MLVVLFLYIDFINGFSIFCNLYCSLIGFYFTFTGLLLEERLRLKSIFPLKFGFYNLKFNDVIKVFKIIIKFDDGIEIDIPGYNKIPLYIFVMYYIRDIF